jgi:hypothetical protein
MKNGHRKNYHMLLPDKFGYRPSVASIVLTHPVLSAII